MIIDFHTHAFPDRIAARSMETLSEKGGKLKAVNDGTVAGLKKSMLDAGIGRAVALNIAVTPKQQQNVNDFASSLLDDSILIPFGSVCPDAPDALYELDRIKALGLKGIKLHPDYQEFFVDNPRYFPLYKKIARLGLVTVFHAGADIGLYEPVHCTPEGLSEALMYFDGAPVIAAHFGGYLNWYDVERYLVGKDVYFDTAYCFAKLPFLHAQRITERHSPGKVVFGSDAPWSAPEDELRLVYSLELSDNERELILGKNAMKLLDIC